MTKKVEFFTEGIGIKPVSADPTNPKIGQMQYSDGTHRKEGVWQYTAIGWCPAGGKIDNLSEIGDVPAYAGNADKILAVNPTEDGIKYSSLASNFNSDSYVPSTAGMGTVSGVTATYMQIGNMLHIQGSLSAGTPSANLAKVYLPAGFTIKTGQAKRIVGYSNRTNPSTPYPLLLTSLATGDDTFIEFAYADDAGIGGDPLDPLQGSFFLDASEAFHFTALVEVNEGIGTGFAGGLNIEDFQSLTDTPIGYTGEAGKAVVVNQAEDGLEFSENSLKNLPDTPSSYLIQNHGKAINYDFDTNSFVFASPDNTLYTGQHVSIFREKKSVLTPFGDLNSGSFQERNLALSTVDAIRIGDGPGGGFGGISIGSVGLSGIRINPNNNGISYDLLVEVTLPAYRVGSHQGKVTSIASSASNPDVAIEYFGTSEYSDPSSGTQTASKITFNIGILGTDNRLIDLELYQRCEFTRSTDGLGVSSPFSEAFGTEVKVTVVSASRVL